MAEPFDPAQFQRTVPLQALRVPKQEVHSLSCLLRRLGALFDWPRLQAVRPAPDAPDERLVLLHADAGAGLLGLSDAARSLLAERSLAPEPYELRLGYEYLLADAVLKVLLPPGLEAPTSFETVGHIAHLNLRDELLPFKAMIGRVLLDKNSPSIRTVLNKVGTIDSEFRVPTFEVIAGDSCLETEVKQHGVTFRLDYGEVYWNSRLEAEHRRLVDSFGAGETVCDMMAGVGPFAVPAGRRRLTVLANDLNPRCAHFLRLNARLNKVEDRVSVFNMDARAFLRALAGHGTDASPEAPSPCAFDHVIMNLPASAVSFLDSFEGAFSGPQWAGRSLPLVHCYSFIRTGETAADVRKSVESALGSPLPEAPTVVMVRDVAPNKEMICITFRVPPFGRTEEEPLAKRQRGDPGADSGEAAIK